MNVVRIVLGMMMLGSSLWLLSLLTVHIGSLPVITLGVLLILTLLLVTAWRYRWQTALRAGVLAVVVAGRSRLYPVPAARVPAAIVSTGSRSASRPLPARWRRNKRVFVDVTADWCVTCKANKYNVLLRDDVQDALSAPDVVALRGRLEPPPQIPSASS